MGGSRKVGMKYAQQYFDRKRSKRRTATGEAWDTTRGQRRNIYSRDFRRCAYCYEVAGPFQIDHIIPMWEGGDSTDGNLVIACKPCNQLKGASVNEDWLRLLLSHETPGVRRTARIHVAKLAAMRTGAQS